MARKVSQAQFWRFVDEVIGKSSRSQYFSSISTMPLRAAQIRLNIMIALEAGESLDDECIVIRFKPTLDPKHYPAPFYRRIRVFSESAACTVRRRNKTTKMLETMARARKSIARRAMKNSEAEPRTWPVENHGPYPDTAQ